MGNGEGRQIQCSAAVRVRSTADADPSDYKREQKREMLRRLDCAIAQPSPVPNTVSEVADDLGYSVGHFARLVREFTGYSPKRYMLRERMRQAQSLLRDTSLTVTAVGGQVGYSDRRYFANVFRREVGMSPGSWRRRQRSHRHEVGVFHPS